jgi:hypothetical protein
MIKFKFNLSLILFLSVSIFFSCREEETPSQAWGDVLIRSAQSGDSILYGVYYYIFSWEKISKATVYKDGENSKIELDSLKGRYNYIYIPDSSDLKTSKPRRAKYIFNVEFDNGEKFESYDILDSISLLPTVFKECFFDRENQRIIIDWQLNALADQYIVVLERENKEIVFQSETLNANQTYLWISSNSYGWYKNKQPVGGEQYKVLITAYQYEPIPTYFDLQSVSEAESGIIEWIVN